MPRAPRAKIVPVENPEKPESMYQWFEKRAIGRAVVDQVGCYVTLRGAERCIVFPYMKDHVLVNRKYRTAEKRFYQDKDAERSLFNIDAVTGDSVIFVEGEMDVLACIEAGYDNAVTLPDGAPAKVSEDGSGKRFDALTTCEDRLASVKRYILATDADGPGQALAEELSRRFGRENCWLVKWPALNDVQRKDANEVLIDDGPEVLRECIEAAEPYPVTGLFEAQSFTPNVMEIFRGEREPGLSTGWRSLDEHLKVRGGDLTIVTGIPSHGKTEVIDALTMNLARLHNWKFVLCSFENQVDEHIGKLAEKYTHAPFWPGPTRRMTEPDLTAAVKWITERFYFIQAGEESPTVDWILERASVAVRRYGVRGLVIDPYNEIEHAIPSSMTEASYISLILGKIRRWAQNHSAHVWFVAHPAKMYRTKDGEIPIPNLYDISGSAAWSAKADFGIVVHRPSFDSPMTEIHVRKVRHKWLGRPGVVKLRYSPATGEYFDDAEVLDD